MEQNERSTRDGRADPWRSLPARRHFDHRLRVWLPSTGAALQRAVAQVRRLARKCGCDDDHLADLEIALREALANAINHGNGPESAHKIFLRCYAGAGAGILVLVRDQGTGFDPTRVPDPRQGDRLQLHHGRGLLLMRELMDQVEHRRGGREVAMFRKIGE